MSRTRRTLTILALTTTFMGCSTQTTPATTPTLLAEPLRIDTTTATMPLIIDLTTAYNAVQPRAVFDTQDANYQTILRNMLIGETPYFMSNHIAADSQLWAAPIAQDGIAIIVHPDVGLDNLSMEELRDIYQGRVGSWRRVGAETGNITIYSRENGSGTRAEFERMVMGRRRITTLARVAISSENMIVRVASTPGSLGYVSTSHVDDQVKVVSVDGILPTTQSIASNRYPLRSMIFIVGQEEPEAFYRDFIGWIQSPSGQEIVAERFTPLLEVSK